MKLIFLLSLLFFSIHVHSQNTFSERIYENVGGLTTILKKTADGGIITSGNQYSTNDFIITKTDSFGNIEFCRTLGLNTSMFASDILDIPTGYLIIGQAYFDTLIFIKIDFNGLYQSSVAYSCPYTIFPGTAIQRSNGSIRLPASLSQSSYIGFVVLDLDSSYNLISAKKYDSPYQGASDVFEDSTGDFYIAGGSFLGPLLTKCDYAGNVLWNKSYSFADGSDTWAIVRAPDNGFVIGLTILSSSIPQGRKASLIKLDSGGNVEWTKSYTQSASNLDVISLRVLGNNGYILSGNISPITQVEQDAFLIRTDSSGNIMWSNRYGGPDYENNFSRVLDYNSGFVIAGSSVPVPNSTFPTSYLVKTDSLGIVSCNEDTIETQTQIDAVLVTSANITPSTISFNSVSIPQPTQISEVGHILCASTNIETLLNEFSVAFYPNPVIQNAIIQIKNVGNKFSQLKIFNSLGSNISTRKITESQTEIDCSYLPNGIYFYQLSSSENNATGKFVVAH